MGLSGMCYYHRARGSATDPEESFLIFNGHSSIRSIRSLYLEVEDIPDPNPTLWLFFQRHSTHTQVGTKEGRSSDQCPSLALCFLSCLSSLSLATSPQSNAPRAANMALLPMTLRSGQRKVGLRPMPLRQATVLKAKK